MCPGLSPRNSLVGRLQSKRKVAPVGAPLMERAGENVREERIGPSGLSSVAFNLRNFETGNLELRIIAELRAFVTQQLRGGALASRVRRDRDRGGGKGIGVKGN